MGQVYEYICTNKCVIKGDKLGWVFLKKNQADDIPSELLFSKIKRAFCFEGAIMLVEFIDNQYIISNKMNDNHGYERVEVKDEWRIDSLKAENYLEEQRMDKAAKKKAKELDIYQDKSLKELKDMCKTSYQRRILSQAIQNYLWR